MPSSALDYITIQGFKSIASIEKLPLRPINLLIGANGSGKSNFIGVFAFLQAIREGKLAQYVTTAGGAEKVLHFGSKVTKEIAIHLSFENERNQYQIRLAPTGDDGLFPSLEIVSFWNKAYSTPYDKGLVSAQQGREAGISDPRNDGIAKWVRSHLEGWRLYHVHDTSSSSPMRKTAKVNDNQFLRADGSNLASFLYFLRERHYDSYNLIQRTVQRVAPFFDDFQLKPLNLKPDDIQLEWRHKRSSDQYFDASSLSDGTLRFVALATLFLQPSAYRPSVILVDEPELGLHPYAIEMLASLMRQASVDTQLVVSTQSSLLLDHFKPDDVLVANRVDDGTQLERLKSEQLESWLKDYSLGQLWEKNEIRGRPVPA
jgi:predicted ATPase